MSGCCPVCRRKVSEEGHESPFCSDRCRLVDLGRWLDGSYRVPDPDSPVVSAESEGGDGSSATGDSDDSTVH